MTIQLRPEVEAMIQQDIAHGPYQSVEEFVEQAVMLLHEQEDWLTTNRNEIAARIEQGWLSAQRGNLIDSEQVKAGMQEKKIAWLKQRPPA